jgi:hypothetical protein
VHHRWPPTRRGLSINVVTHIKTFSYRVRRHSMLAPLELENRTLSTRSPSFAASRLRDSHNQIINNKTPSPYPSRAKRCCKDPLNAVWLPASEWCTSATSAPGPRWAGAIRSASSTRVVRMW